MCDLLPPKAVSDTQSVTNLFDLVRSFDLVQIFDLVWSFDLPRHASVAQGGFCLFLLKDFPFVLVSNLLYSLLDVVEDVLAQGAEGFRVDDDGVEFSPKGVNYFPTMGDETKKDKCSIFLLLFIICLVLMLMDRASYGCWSCFRTRHTKGELTKVYEHSTQSIGELTDFKSGLMQQGAGLDELKHDLSIEESVAHKCKNAIIENEHEITSLCGANIEPNKADPEEVADLDPDQLPSSASEVLVSSIVPISSLSHKTFAHTTGLKNSNLVCPSMYRLLRSSSGDSGPDVSFDVSASLKHLSGSAYARLATSTLSSIGGPSLYIMPDDQFHIFVCHGAFEPASDMLLYPFAHTSLGSVSSSMHSFSTSTWKASCFGASEFLFLNLHVRVSKEFLFPYPTDQALFTRLTPGPTDGANVEAYLRGPLGLGKRASNVRIIWFSFGSFGSVSFGSSAESKNVVQLRILWRLLQLLRPLAENGLDMRAAPEVCSGSLLQPAPKKEEELMVYLSAADEAVSVVLLVERDERQTPIHYGASNEYGFGAGLILIDPEGAEYSYALRLNFANSNNDAEYEALLAAWPFRKWGIDIIGPLPEAPSKIKYLIVAIDYFTKWFGIPTTIITDNRTQLINDPFKSWAERLGINLVSTSVYHPQVNGAVERANRSIMQGIKTRLHQEGGTWVEEFLNVLWAHRTTPKTSNRETPFSLAYGTEAVILAEIGIPTRRVIQEFDERNEEALRLNLNLLEERRDIAAIREARRKQQVEKYYNQRVHHKQFNVGKFVLRKNELSKVENTGKLRPKWEGPYEVVETYSTGAYKLRSMDGA
ncbi:reverse transcriptase domain-containing protein [Tanacetum coccineum]